MSTAHPFGAKDTCISPSFVILSLHQDCREHICIFIVFEVFFCLFVCFMYQITQVESI